MKYPPAQELRAKLDFEQQARFDAMLEKRKKQQGAATGLSMPLLGTFGLEQFYLGNTARGVLSVLFCWTFIPTVSALFDVFSGDLKRQVAHANARVAKTVYDEVIRNTPQGIAPVATAPAPAPAAPPVTAPVAVAAPAATATVVAADVIAPTAAPVAEAAVVTEQEETVAESAATFTATVATSDWHAGMNTPETTSATETTSFSAASDVVTTDSAAVVEAAPVMPEDIRSPLSVPVAPPLTSAIIATDAPVEAAPLEPAQVEADAQPLLDSDILAADGVLVFTEDPTALATSDLGAVAAVTVDQTTVDATQERATETVQASSQRFKDGKLVDATATSVTLTGEINALLADHTQETLLAETEASAPQANWVDVSPLHTETVTDSGAGSQPDTNVPGGGLGDPATNVPGGGLGDPAPTGEPIGGASHRPEDGPIAE